MSLSRGQSRLAFWPASLLCFLLLVSAAVPARAATPRRVPADLLSDFVSITSQYVPASAGAFTVDVADGVDILAGGAAAGAGCVAGGCEAAGVVVGAYGVYSALKYVYNASHSEPPSASASNDSDPSNCGRVIDSSIGDLYVHLFTCPYQNAYATSVLWDATTSAFVVSGYGYLGGGYRDAHDDGNQAVPTPPTDDTLRLCELDSTVGTIRRNCAGLNRVSVGTSECQDVNGNVTPVTELGSAFMAGGDNVVGSAPVPSCPAGSHRIGYSASVAGSGVDQDLGGDTLAPSAAAAIQASGDTPVLVTRMGDGTCVYGAAAIASTDCDAADASRQKYGTVTPGTDDDPSPATAPEVSPEPTAQPSTDPGGDPSSAPSGSPGGDPDPSASSSASPAPGATPVILPNDGSPTSSCDPEGWGWNPIHWVEKPVECAIAWSAANVFQPMFTDLFVPSASATSEWSNLDIGSKFPMSIYSDMSGVVTPIAGIGQTCPDWNIHVATHDYDFICGQGFIQKMRDYRPELLAGMLLMVFAPMLWGIFHFLMPFGAGAYIGNSAAQDSPGNLGTPENDIDLYNFGRTS